MRDIFINILELLIQFPHLIRPEGVIAPVRKICAETGIFLLTAYPVEEIKHSHCAERFDKHLAVLIELPEFIITLDHQVEFYLRI